MDEVHNAREIGELSANVKTLLASVEAMRLDAQNSRAEFSRLFGEVRERMDKRDIDVYNRLGIIDQWRARFDGRMLGIAGTASLIGGLIAWIISLVVKIKGTPASP